MRSFIIAVFSALALLASAQNNIARKYTSRMRAIM